MQRGLSALLQENFLHFLQNPVRKIFKHAIFLWFFGSIENFAKITLCFSNLRIKSQINKYRQNVENSKIVLPYYLKMTKLSDNFWISIIHDAAFPMKV